MVAKAYEAVCQTGGALHTMTVLQAYQADLLRDMDQGQVLSPKVVAELRHTTDLALRAPKQTMMAMLITERHLWMNLPSCCSDFTLWTLWHFRRDNSGEEVKVQLVAFRRCIPRHSNLPPTTTNPPDHG